ncbi:MAG: YiaA/YiaB family inner membrane protein [Bacteroidota bacterium]
MSHSLIDHSNSKSFHNMAWIAFVLAISGTLAGIVLLPATLAIKGFLAMGFLFTVSSCFTLAKVVRDRHEADRLYNKVERAKTEKFLSESEDPSSIL